MANNILLEFEEWVLPLRRRFRIARIEKSEQVTVVVKLSSHGEFGLGEASPNAYYGISLPTMRATLNRVALHLQTQSLTSLEEICDGLQKVCGDDTFTLAAVEIALYDLWGRLQGLPVWKLIGGSRKHLPQSSVTIGMGSLAEVHESLNHFSAWPCYKVKLSGDSDAAAVLNVIEQRETGAAIRVDGNCGFLPGDALRVQPLLKAHQVQLFEQPLPPSSWQEMGELVRHFEIPLIADESCRTVGDVARCADYFHGINIKLGKCGGISAALRMIAEARRFHLRIMIGCMTESSIAMSAAAQLASFVDDLDVDGALLLANDPVEGFAFDKGDVELSDRPGLGVHLAKSPAFPVSTP